ncbi:hypothetical protein LTR72_005651 [Exophiala xenobiotica]|nr:hypothetical protein LTR72_005651 [Exophiala xenobiotica]KAK5485815.1 hypothetical protein LTR55_005493 [Exophiala xenobiotica]
MATKSRPISMEPMTVPEISEGTKNEVAVPPSPTRRRATDKASTRRQTRGLSLNFPTLLPTNAQICHSPTASPNVLQSPVESARSSPRTRTAPFPSPGTTHEFDQTANTRGSTDFLTLLAAQERRVLELREELQKAEADLLGLKKQWAAHEANKKRDEVKHVKKLQPLALDDVGGREPSEDEIDEERRRKRAIVERSQTHNTNPGNTPGNNLNRKGSKRVFEGGRHTRTLSLLSPTSNKPGHATATISLTELVDGRNEAADRNSESDMVRPPLSKISTLDSLVAGEQLQLGFGKTYKDLAAHSRSVPSAEVLVKQGKQVYDGVREGLWTFFEDIRQATVGEEGVNGSVADQRPARPHPKRVGKDSSARPNRTTNGKKKHESTEPSFWKEFGLDTPQRLLSTQVASGPEKSNGHIPQKSSTDSSNPPSLLPDTTDQDEVEEGWDAWDSPMTTRERVHGKEANKAEVGLPWPDIEKLTPSKLTRTVSDLMREWNASQDEANTTTDGSKQQTSGKRASILDSPHI